MIEINHCRPGATNMPTSAEHLDLLVHGSAAEHHLTKELLQVVQFGIRGGLLGERSSASSDRIDVGPGQGDVRIKIQQTTSKCNRVVSRAINTWMRVSSTVRLRLRASAWFCWK